MDLYIKIIAVVYVGFSFEQRFQEAEKTPFRVIFQNVFSFPLISGFCLKNRGYLYLIITELLQDFQLVSP